MEEASPEEVPQNWLFTFGYGHTQKTHFVKIFGTYSSSRDEMVRRYSDKWAFQYPEKDEQKLKHKFYTELKE